MSLILDALRRAERARNRDLARRLGDAMPPRAPRSAAWWPAGVAILLVAVATGIVALVLRAPPPAPANEVATLATAPLETPSTAAAPSRGSSLAEIALPELEPVPEPAPVHSTAPLLEELPASVRTAIPTVAMNAHYWTSDPARRFVMLDMTRYREGDTVRPGLRVVLVVPDGVEMDWRGTRFRLPAR